ncbi:uncharacterized protein V6R79_006671 [Siganus canaliculatus]
MEHMGCFFAHSSLVPGGSSLMMKHAEVICKEVDGSSSENQLLFTFEPRPSSPSLIYRRSPLTSMPSQAPSPPPHTPPQTKTQDPNIELRTFQKSGPLCVNKATPAAIALPDRQQFSEHTDRTQQALQTLQPNGIDGNLKVRSSLTIRAPANKHRITSATQY